MAITAVDLKIVIRGVLNSQQVEVVQWYRPEGAAFLTADPAGVGEAYWNDIKTLWRSCHRAASNDVTTSILVSEPGASGAYGEFAIPVGEQQGTRAAPTQSEYLPPYCAAAVRLTVATRATRPGQKRFWGLLEEDNSNGALGSAMAALVASLAPKFSSVLTLGAPVATGNLFPEIVHLEGSPEVVTARQDVAGFIVAPNVSTQNSRKIGRGV